MQKSASPWSVLARPALAFATEAAAARPLEVTLFDAASEIGGQFNVAKQIPGKEEFYETLRYFGERLKQTGVTVKLGSTWRQTIWCRRASSTWCWPPAFARACRRLRAWTTPKVLGYPGRAARQKARWARPWP